MFLFTMIMIENQTLGAYKRVLDVNKSSPFSAYLELWKNEKRMNEIRQNEDNRIVTRAQMWRNYIDNSNSMSLDVNKDMPKDEKLMGDIAEMMKMSIHLAEKNRMHLEPFQLEAIRACIASTSRRMLKHNVYKYKQHILYELGMIENVTLNSTLALDKDRTKEINSLFQDYAKRFIAVIAPRRNGKSKAGKLFVAVNAVYEESARIVLIAHNMNAVLLYKNELLQILSQIQELSSLYQFNIRSSGSEIILEFTDGRPNSFIYFVAGGVNVSIYIFFCFSIRACSRQMFPILVSVDGNMSFYTCAHIVLSVCPNLYSLNDNWCVN
jgi:hypothetical protein